jgi:hypothetical protein
MTILGLSAITPPKAGLGVDFRAGWLKHVGLAISGASGAAIVIGAYDVLRSQPDRAFALLQGWGPAFLIAMIAYFLIVTIRESFSVVAQSVLSSAHAAGRTADALTRLADLNGDQARETQRLATFAAQGTESMLERFDKQDTMLVDLGRNIKGLHSLLSQEKAALELKKREELLRGDGREL